MELASEEAVAWFWDVGVREKFPAKFHPEARIKSRDYHVIAQFVPLTFWPDRAADIQEVEEINGMDKGDSIRARWIKPVARWVPHQTCGHAIFTLQTPQAANEVLVNGLFVQQKKIYTEKCKREPLRCLRCHGWGHTWCVTAQHQLIPVGCVHSGTGLTHVLTRPSPTAFHVEGQGT